MTLVALTNCFKSSQCRGDAQAARLEKVEPINLAAQPLLPGQ